MIIFTHHTGEPHGILGPQAAATHLSRKLGIPAIVVGLTREFSVDALLPFVGEHYEGRERVVAFSHLCGRKDLLALIAKLKERDFKTVLGGPQARVDYLGEEGHDEHPGRFQGLKRVIDIAIQGPVDRLDPRHLATAGCRVFEWHRDIGLDVDWSNLYTFTDRLEPLHINVAQVLHAVGCPHASKTCQVELPATFGEANTGRTVTARGCTFCDVARDKGFHGALPNSAVLAQLIALPERDGQKIPFELINEYPVGPLARLLEDAGNEGIELSQVNLVCRVDAITAQEDLLDQALRTARNRGVRVMFSSIGFESFSDRILGYFNKGVTVDDIVTCVGILRKLKDRYRETLLYRTDEGACHGFIHPTPWDNAGTMPEIDWNIVVNRLYEDVLPPHSIPLIIHHSSYLADWIRSIEDETGLTFPRDATWIEWWSAQTAGEGANSKS